MIKEFKEFKEGHRYLVNNEDHFLTNLKELTVLEISQIAIKVKWSEGSTEWIAKDRFFFRLKEELPDTKQIIEDRSREIHFDDMRYEKDEPQFTLKMTEENDGEIILKAEENSKLKWEENPSKQIKSWYEV